jgi:hypothetical protein
MSKIALLFLTYGNIIHRNNPILQEYLQNTNVYIHPKYKDEITDEPYKSKIIPTRIETSWGTDTIVMATLLLLKEAYANITNQWFVLCSEDIFPLRSYSQLNSYLARQPNSLFSDMNTPNANTNTNIRNKTQQWWALTRKDVDLLLTALKLNTNNPINIDYVKNQPLFINIANTIPKKAAWDELFFLSALKMIYNNNNNNYVYTNRMICYTKWFPQWTSKHPTIFNKLLQTDKTFIDQHNSCFFIRKTFPTFQNEVITKKENCIIIVIGTENQNIPDYTKFLSMYQNKADIFLLVMTTISDIKSSDIKQACCQCYSVVWNMVEDACNKLKNIMVTQENYTKENVFIIPENIDANNDNTIIWDKLLSRKYNQDYWFNKITGESSWEDPSLITKGGSNKKTKKTKTRKLIPRKNKNKNKNKKTKKHKKSKKN